MRPLGHHLCWLSKLGSEGQTHCDHRQCKLGSKLGSEGQTHCDPISSSALFCVVRMQMYSAFAQALKSVALASLQLIALNAGL
jgi:hypothetical protein